MTSISIQSVTKVKAVVRVRPFLPNEKDETCIKIISSSNQGKTQNTPKLLKHCNLLHTQITDFTFDACYDMNSSQEQIYVEQIYPLLIASFEGINSTIFAYGISGSGKTYTMQGDSSNPGL